MQANRPPHLPPLPSQQTQPAGVPHQQQAQPSAIVKFLPGLIMFSALFGLVILGWNAYQEATSPRDIADLPLIKADNTPYKIKPSDPGGMQIPNLDKSIYDTIASSDVVVEEKEIQVNTSSMPEEPIDREELAKLNAQSTIAMLSDKVEKKAEPVSDKTEETLTVKKIPFPVPDYYATEETQREPAPFSDYPVPVKKPKPEDSPAPFEALISEFNDKKPPLPASMAKKEPPKQVTTTSSTQGVVPVERKVSAAPPRSITAERRVTIVGQKIQLGAYRTPQEVKKSWDDIQKRFPDLLGALDYTTQKADLGSKGTFYRLQVGPIANRDKATLLCNKLIAQNQGCFVVK